MSTLAADLAALVARRHPSLQATVDPAGQLTVTHTGPGVQHATLTVTVAPDHIRFCWADGLLPVLDGTVIGQPSPPAVPVTPDRYATDPTANNIVTAVLDAVIGAFADQDLDAASRITHLQLEEHDRDGFG